MSWMVGTVLAMTTLAGGNEPPDREQVLAVPVELRAQLQEVVIDKGETPARRFELLMDYMFGLEGLQFEYSDDVTRTVADTYHSRQGNCLSFTLMFVTLAREAGLDAYVQEVDRVLIWYRDGDVIFNSRHVNAGLRFGNRRHTVDFDRAVVTPRNRPRPVSDTRALAHFYNNRGAELLAQESMDAAHRYFVAAAELEPGYAAVWNNLGVLHEHAEDTDAAERAYLTALEFEPDHASTLSNLARLYEEIGKEGKIAEYRQRLEEVRHNDPYYQFMRGVELEEGGDHEAALEHFRRAVRLHRDEHEFHFALARVYERLEQPARAQRSLRRAHALGEGNDRELYQAKLDQIRQ